MANECFFSIKVKGEPKKIRKFLKYFIFDDEIGKDNKKLYLARTFINSPTYRKYVNINKEKIDKGEIFFYGVCAWSCWSCWFEGYPNGKELITMEEVLKRCNVKIEVDSEEGGIGFEEHIDNLDGELTYSSEDMKICKCECGNIENISSSYPLKEYVCDECGKIGKWIVKNEKY